MADNFLEKRYDELFGRGSGTKVAKPSVSMDKLLAKNRSVRGYDKSYEVMEAQLRRIIGVNPLVPSALNQQVLRFKMVTRRTGAEKMLPLIRLGGALPQLHLPLEGTEPEAFIIICSTVPEARYVDIDLGISAQSMLLKAVEMGFNGICIAAFDKEKLKEAFALTYEPLLVLAIGKSAEKIETVAIKPEEPHAYYRKDGIHYVPKLQTDDLIIP